MILIKYCTMKKHTLICIIFTLFCSVSVFGQSVDKSIFTALNLDYKGLERVKQEYNAGNYDKAAAELLSYYRSRKGIVNPHVDLSNVRISDKEQKWADLALEHKFYAHEGYEPLFYGKDTINWNYWPVKDDEQRLQFHRHQWYVPMGKAYYLSKNEKYAADWTKVYLDWVANNPVPEKIDKAKLRQDPFREWRYTDPNRYFAWRHLGSSQRMADHYAYMLYFINSPSFTPAFLTQFL